MLNVIFGQLRVPQQSNQAPHQNNKKSIDTNPFETTTTKSEEEKNDKKIKGKGKEPSISLMKAPSQLWVMNSSPINIC